MADGRKGALLNFWRNAGWGGAAALLLAPLLAMRVADEVNWSVGDATTRMITAGFAGVLFFSAVLFSVAAKHKTRSD